MNPLQAGKVVRMDRTTIRQIRSILEENLPSIMEENHLKFDLGNASFDDDSVKFQFRISLENAIHPEEKALNQNIEYRKAYEDAISLDTSIIANQRGSKFKLVGFKPRSRKRPYIIQDTLTGKRFVTSEREVERMFKEVK